ncbi:protein lethal(2)k10201 [Condylostylus longicornis]|uniref:protein lethal(2)k10201 n=1 Tax=Condylostylus longicornis TaxID=2530218 RepID=UPI00244DCEDC|nr:protein lethal(2)k10201 [Condylostylus longicornis]
MFSNNFLSQENIVTLLSTIDVGYKEPSDPFFEKCDKLKSQFKKLGVITLVEESDLHSKLPVSCNIPGCNQMFDTIFEFETHYNSLHRYLCSFCKKNLPSAHLLDLHVSESHDSFFAAQAEKKAMFSCFIAECSYKSLNADERKDHCIRDHKFPSNFRFETSSTSNIKLEKCQEKIDDTGAMDTSNEKASEAINKLEPSNLNFFSFGHQRIKTFDRSKKGKAKNNKKKLNSEVGVSPLEDEEMVTDLLDSLPNKNC